MSPASAKKRKVESFQQKEKRKRDMGQATSDKSFVEEEKRILRQKIEWDPKLPQKEIGFIMIIIFINFLCFISKEHMGHLDWCPESQLDCKAFGVQLD